MNTEAQFARPLPQNLEAEKAVLGGLLADAANLPDIRRMLSADSFMDKEHRLIWQAICSQADEGKPIDAELVAPRVADKLDRPILRVIGDVFQPLMDGVAGSAANTPYYAELVQDSHRRRIAVVRANQLAEAAYSGNGEFTQVVEQTRTDLGRIITATEVQQRTFTARQIAELLAKPEEETPWLVDGLLPAGGFSILGGKPKAGKSTFARCCVLAVAQSGRFIGRACHGGTVIYAGFEDKPSETVGHFRGLGATDEPVLIVTEPPPQDLKVTVTELEALIRETGAVLLVIDTMARLVRARDFNDYAEVTRKLEPIINLARRTGCHIMALHHLGKNDREDGDSLLGSTAIYGTADVVVTLKRSPSGRVLSSRQRYGADMEPTVLGFDAVTRSITVVSSVAEAERASKAQEIQEVLAGSSEPMTRKEICEAVGGRRGDVLEAITFLVENDAINMAALLSPCPSSSLASASV